MVNEKVVDETSEDPAAGGAPASDPQAAPLRCDFCGQEASRVRRIALDGQYDRLQQPHQPQYACDACSAEKERERLARASG